LHVTVLRIRYLSISWFCYLRNFADVLTACILTKTSQFIFLYLTQHCDVVMSPHMRFSQRCCWHMTSCIYQTTRRRVFSFAEESVRFGVILSQCAFCFDVFVTYPVLLLRLCLRGLKPTDIRKMYTNLRTPSRVHSLCVTCCVHNLQAVRLRCLFS
jgi:hypothetical protein